MSNVFSRQLLFLIESGQKNFIGQKILNILLKFLVWSWKVLSSFTVVLHPSAPYRNTHSGLGSDFLILFVLVNEALPPSVVGFEADLSSKSAQRVSLVLHVSVIGHQQRSSRVEGVHGIPVGPIYHLDEDVLQMLVWQREPSGPRKLRWLQKQQPIKGTLVFYLKNSNHYYYF